MNSGPKPTLALPNRFYQMDWFYRAGWVLLRRAFRVWFHLRVNGLEFVPKTGGAIIASNHASYLDPPLIGAALHRPVAYLARKSLFRFKPFGWLIARLNAVPLERERATAAGLRTAIELLEAGVAVVLFPEGTRTPNGSLQSGKPGAGLIALRSNVPVIPTRIKGSFEAMPRGSWFPKPTPISISFGRPVALDDLRAAANEAPQKTFKSLCQAASDRIMASIANL